MRATSLRRASSSPASTHRALQLHGTTASALAPTAAPQLHRLCLQAPLQTRLLPLRNRRAFTTTTALTAPPPPKMSTMPATHGHNEACCNIPPVVSKGYKPKARTRRLAAGRRVCLPNALSLGLRILSLRLVSWGMETLTIGGVQTSLARRMQTRPLFSSTTSLATLTRRSRAPTFSPMATRSKSTRSLSLTGSRASPAPSSGELSLCVSHACSPADGVRYPPNTEEKKKNLGNFFGTFPPPKIAGYVPDYVKALKEKNPSVSKYGIIGVSPSRTPSRGTLFDHLRTHLHRSDVLGRQGRGPVRQGLHQPLLRRRIRPPGHGRPGRRRRHHYPHDAARLQGGARRHGQEVRGRAQGAQHVETFSDQIHGWMGARADLDDARVKEEYERGYKTVLSFFANNF